MEELNGDDGVDAAPAQTALTSKASPSENNSVEGDYSELSTKTVNSTASENGPGPDQEPPDLELAIGLQEETPIDDDEFGIPQLDVEPSLESILRDIDSESVSDEGEPSTNLVTGPGANVEYLNAITIPEGSDTISIQSRESDNRSRASSRSAGTRHKHKEKKPPVSILRHVLLKGLTSQINSAAERINAGSATTITTGYLAIAVGTSHGHVLVFDVSQVLRCCLGEQRERELGGAVSSLSVSANGTRLLVGYAKGLVLMYDLEAGKLLRTITDCHAVATAVLLLRFTDEPTLALCSDSGGSVFELNFKRTMGIRGCDSRCIFSGSRGEVCTFEPLMQAGFENPLSKFVIVALATLSKVIVVTIRPKLKVLFTQPLTADPTTLPLLAWQMVIIQTTSNEKIVDPVLTFGRGEEISFYQTTCSEKNSVQFLPLRKVRTSFSMLSLHWINPRTLVLLDTRERLHVMDVRSQEELESIDLSGVKLVYASSHFKGLATGGNVSRGFALAGERACYNSVLCINNQLVILGTKSVHALTMRLWHERLDYLVKLNHHTEAISLGYELYLEKAKAIVGLRGSRDSKRGVVREKTLYTLDQLVDRLPMLNYLEDLGTAKSNYSDVISTCVNYFVLLDHVDPIFEKLYENAGTNPIAKAAYLEALEPYVLNDRLRAAIPPTIVKEFITHYEEIGNYKALEACVVHLNVDTLDIHQTMKLCWTHGLYDAIIYIYNQGMSDYVTPLEELMTELQGALQSSATALQLTASQLMLGNRILVYTSCCLAGRAYPYGDIPAHLLEKVQGDVFQCITTLHSRNAGESEESYPYLKALLRFDTREFLNVLSLSFEEPVFQTELGRRQKQRLVDILLQIMVEQSSFTPTEVGILFTFLARQMARPDNSLFVSTLLFEQVLEHLTSANETTRIDERQQALLELLQAGGLQHLETQKLVTRCRAAGFYRVCEMLYEKTKEYDKILECYLLDASRNHQVFSYLHKVFCTVPGQRATFLGMTRANLVQLVDIDSKKTAQIICHHFTDSIPEFVQSLASRPDKQYLFLKGVFSLREQGQQNIPIPITEKYIELMCTYEPAFVCPFLKLDNAAGGGYRLERVMEICKNKNLTEAVVYLLEKDGKYSEAFALLLDQFRVLMASVASSTEQKELVTAAIFSSPAWSQLQHQFLALIEFSNRNSPRLSSGAREQLWLPILQILISAYNQYQQQAKSEAENKSSSSQSHSRSLASAFNEMNKHLLGCMMSHVSLPTVVEVVMNNPSYECATFSEIREIVMGMLDTCGYEETMVNLVKRISESDVHSRLHRKYKTVHRGFTVSNKVCPCCRRPVFDGSVGAAAGVKATAPSAAGTSSNTNANTNATSNSNVIVFQCGHTFHVSCSEQYGISGCPQCRPLEAIQVPQDILFQAERPFHVGHADDEDEDAYSQAQGHNEFELKLDAPFKVTPKDF